MRSKHDSVKQKLKKIVVKSELQNLFDSLALDENERTVMNLHYCEKVPLKEIAVEIGYSEAGVIKVHNRVLERIGTVLSKDS